MRTGTKVWLVTAAVLVLIGCILFVGVMTMLRWDFTALSTVTYETNTHEINGEINGISINTDTADIVFAFSDDGQCRVECYEKEDAKHTVDVKDGNLNVTLADERSVYNLIGHIGLNFVSPRITVYLPKAEYTSLRIKEDTGAVEIPAGFTFEDVDISLSTGDVDFRASASETVKIKASTGDIRVEHISAGALDLSVSTGRITVSDVTCEGDVAVGVSTGKARLTDITCKNVTSSGNTGDISLDNVIAAETFSIKRSTGDIRFVGCDAAEIFAQTDTGDVMGSLLTEKVFIAQTDTGRVDVPKTTSGGRCEVRTDTGNIKLTIR